MRRGHLILALLLAGCVEGALKEGTDTGDLPPVIPNQYNIALSSLIQSSTATEELEDNGFRIVDSVGAGIPQGVARFRVTRGTFTANPILTDTAGRGRVVWHLPFPIIQQDSLFGCAVDPGFDCIPNNYLMSIGAATP